MHFQRILHPTDFSDLSQKALQYAAEMAHDHGARLLILHAVETLGPENVTYGEVTSQLQPEGFKQRLWDELYRVKSPRSDVEVEYLLSDQDPATAIVTTAVQRGCDLIVLASHDRAWLKRLLMGSVAEQVIRKAACPVLVVKGNSPFPTNHPQEATLAIHPERLIEPRK